MSSATFPSTDKLIPPVSAPRRRAARGNKRWVFLFFVTALGVAGWSYADSIRAWFSGGVQVRVLSQPVRRGDLVITVLEDGNVESASNVDIKCEVAGGSVILSIVPDGTHVKKGDKVVELDSSTISENVSAQKIVLEKAIAARIQVEKEFSAAKIAVEEYLQGTFVKEMQGYEALIKIAMENLRSSENTLQHTERMSRKGYVTPLQLEAQRFAVERSKLDLNTAQTAKDVLDKFTKPKMLEELQSKRDSAEARWRSEKAACELEEQRLKRFQTQLEKCVILAPQDGMVIYANEMGGRSSQSVKIEEGAAVRERQSIIRLPDLSQMQVKCLVHESKVEQLTTGQRAHVKLLDRVFQGVVRFVANQPEPSSFFSSNVKEYAAFVRIEGEVQDVRPGMTAEVEILIAEKRGVLTVPVQSVVEQGRQTHSWVRTPRGVERRTVLVGASNSERIEIKDGIGENEEVVLNPRTVIAEARDESKEEAPVDVDSKFGKSKGGATSGSEKGEASKGEAPKGEAGKGGDAAKKGPTMSFSELDKNGDKKISREEAPERMQSFFDRVDTNADGSIDPSEFAAMRARSASKNKAGGGPPE